MMSRRKKTSTDDVSHEIADAGAGESTASAPPRHSLKGILNAPVLGKKSKLYRGKIELPRLRIVRAHYAFLIIMALTGSMISKSVVLYADAGYVYSLEYHFPKTSALFMAISCVVFTLFAMSAAGKHSKNYDEEILEVFAEMKKQGLTKFSYELEPWHPEAGQGVRVVHLVKTFTEIDSGDDMVLVKPVDKSVEITHDKHRSSTFRVSDIKEIKILNQADFFRDEPIYLAKSERIRRMLSSDRQQLIAFVGAYVFALFCGFFLAFLV